MKRMTGLRERFPPRRVLRLLGWNLLILFILLALVAGGAEIYLRATVPFRENVLPLEMAPGVGVTRPPHGEVRHTDGRDFWQVSRANSLGFLDREPPPAERAAASCHVTFIGDSFVEAKEVPIAHKAHVRLEELAAREAPALDVTTSAFGFSGTAQINQLAFYDAYARGLSPDVVVLVFVLNDFEGNSLGYQSWFYGRSPDHPPWLYARRGPDGEMEFVPPAASLEEMRANLFPRWPRPPLGSAFERTTREWSYLADRLWTISSGTPWHRLFDRRPGRRQWLHWAEVISEHPRYRDFAEGWEPLADGPPHLLSENPPPIFREMLDATRFALEQFHERAERDGAALVVLAHTDLGGEKAKPWFDLLREMVAAAGEDTPVISLYDYVIAAGDDETTDIRWKHDGHWTALGHRRVAEAILQWLSLHPRVCD